MLRIFYLFPQLWATFARKFMKRPIVFFHIWKLQLYFYMFPKFLCQKIKKKIMPCVSIWEQNLVYSSNFEQYFRHQKSSKFCNVFFNFVSYLTLPHSLVMTTFLQGKLQLFQCYNKMQNFIKKSLLCGRFSPKSKSFKRWIKCITKYGLSFVKSEKIRFVTHRFSKIQPIKLAISFWKFAFTWPNYSHRQIHILTKVLIIDSSVEK